MTWPFSKNQRSHLPCRQGEESRVSFHRLLGSGSRAGGEGTDVEHDIARAEGPAGLARVEEGAQRERAPHEGLVDPVARSPRGGREMRTRVSSLAAGGLEGREEDAHRDVVGDCVPCKRVSAAPLPSRRGERAGAPVSTPRSPWSRSRNCGRPSTRTLRVPALRNSLEKAPTANGTEPIERRRELWRSARSERASAATNGDDGCQPRARSSLARADVQRASHSSPDRVSARERKPPRRVPRQLSSSSSRTCSRPWFKSWCYRRAKCGQDEM